MSDVVTAIGVISGTSMDGIDVALVETDGRLRVQQGAGRTYPYDTALKTRLGDVVRNGVIAQTDPLADLEREVTDAHVAAVERFMAETGVRGDNIRVVGFHGQTVWHNPAQRFTRQLMDGARAASKLGLDCVTRFRHADVAAGGQGAPLVPLYHKALADGLETPLMILNLGGVGNVTYLDGETVIAFDTGPASALIDDWMARRRGVAFDRDGAFAATGTVDPSILAGLMAHPYFARPAPKSLDRQAFHQFAAAVDTLSDADGAATLTAFTIDGVVAALSQVPKRPRRWLVCGGGRLNRSLMNGFRARLGVPVDPVESAGWNGDDLEAACFGYLAVRSLRGLPLSLPTTTGVPRPMPGGVLFPR